MANVKVNDKEYNLKFTLGFWESMKSLHEITRNNMEDKLNEDFGKIASDIVLYGIYYGLPRDHRPDDIKLMEVKIGDIKDQISSSVVDFIEATIIEGMTKAEKSMVEKLTKIRDKKIAEFTEDDLTDKGKKK